MIYCPSINAYLEQYILIMRILSAVTLPVDCFGIYCILYQSCSQIKEYNHLLLMYQGLATALDSLLNLGFIPLVVFPLPIFIPNGVLSPIFGLNAHFQVRVSTSNLHILLYYQNISLMIKLKLFKFI